MTEIPIIQQIADCYRALDPENLIDNQNMLASDILARKRQINTCLNKLFEYNGCVVTAAEAFQWEKDHGM